MAERARQLGGVPTGLSERSVAGKCAIPEMPPIALERPRLLARLDEAAAHRVTVVRGPAGSGKTVLLAQWARGLDRPLGWVTLDDADNDPALLSGVLNAAVRGCLPQPHSRGVVPLPAGRVEPVTEMATVLAGSAGPVTLILDRLERLRPGPAIDLVQALLDLPALTLVLSTRGAPALPLSRWRLAAELVEVDDDELAFTAAEADRLWRAHGRFLADVQTQAILAQTAGWAALVSLAATVADRHVDRAWHDFIGTEVLGPQSQLVRDFLARTSVVESFCAELAFALFDRSESYRLVDQLLDEGIIAAAHAPAGLITRIATWNGSPAGRLSRNSGSTTRP
jgi:LuxR family maltose regulon positive regulatory protein